MHVLKSSCIHLKFGEQLYWIDTTKGKTLCNWAQDTFNV